MLCRSRDLEEGAHSGWRSIHAGGRLLGRAPAIAAKFQAALKLRNLTRFPNSGSNKFVIQIKTTLNSQLMSGAAHSSTFIHRGISICTAFCPNTLSHGLRSCLCAQDLGRGRERCSFIGHVITMRCLIVRQHS